ncbi:hypothetical protein K439DRAFT_1639291 [Ramaria rubella]|nr:hypothetical protein K439DRAFT_1639291 [Ramaria rubella]
MSPLAILGRTFPLWSLFCADGAVSQLGMESLVRHALAVRLTPLVSSLRVHAS